MNGFAGTRAERQWLAAIRRIADALEQIAEELEQEPDEACLECGGEMVMASPVGPLFCPDCQPDLNPDRREE